MSFLTMNLVIINDRPDHFVLFSLHISRLEKYRALHLSLLRTVEPLSAVKANHLLGCSINDKVQLYILFSLYPSPLR